MIPDDATRLAMLKRGEADIAYALRGPLAEEVRRTAGLKLVAPPSAGTFWVDFTSEPWDPKSPWHARQAREPDRKKREAPLHQIQKIAYERVTFIPIWEFAQLHGVGPRVAEPGLGLIDDMPFSAPYEELRLQKP
ncbi:MAG: hypothetical protein HYR86_13325 [Candidatus Rokubacteria bacterium]|nr:hypothetical protein [Candidatus Rokubacteria bacterium]